MRDGEVLGAFNRLVVELVVRDQSPVITEQLQMQIDLLLAMPERKKVPRKKRRPWRFWDYGVPVNYSWGEVDEGRRKPPANRTPTVDDFIKSDETIADAEDDPDEEPPGVLVDHTWKRQKAQAATEEAAEADAEFLRKVAEEDADMLAQAARGWRKE